jgi:hypothetical protein
MKPPSFRLGSEEAAFLQIEPLSILVASRGPNNLPFVIRAVGRRFSPDFARLTLLLPARDSQVLLSHVAANRCIAAIFALPSTHQGLQLKGSDAEAERVRKSDYKLSENYRRAFVDHLAALGYPRDLFEAALHCAPDNLAAVSFTPSAVFSQTPGPNAGQAIGVRR